MFDTRRSIVSTAAIVGAVVIGTGLVAAANAEWNAPKPRVRPLTVVRAPAGLLTNDEVLAAPDHSDRVRVGTRPVYLRYTFDGGVRQSITAVGGGHELRPLGQNGGRLSLVPEGSGLALAYPPRCALVRERDCPRAILEGRRDDGLNPGTRRLAYGASVRMSQGDLADGANVIQKGYSVGGDSQFKLQVDHLRGHPSCVVVGKRAAIYRAEAALDVADGRWHNLTCTRTRKRLKLAVDGRQQAVVALPPTLSIANAEPLRVGGKGPSRGNDQYAGRIDNVFLIIG
jgi:concanavalin A-like lectin/glucanase superfamily protein